MSTLEEERGDPPSLVQNLSQATGRADQDDLSDLAKMHTWNVPDVHAGPRGVRRRDPQVLTTDELVQLPEAAR